MRQDDDPALFFRNLANIREDPVDASRIGDLSIFHRDVEVGANEDLLAGDVHCRVSGTRINRSPPAFAFPLAFLHHRTAPRISV